MKKNFIAVGLFIACCLSSCMLGLPARRSNHSTNVEVSNAAVQIEPLKRD